MTEFFKHDHQTQWSCLSLKWFLLDSSLWLPRLQGWGRGVSRRIGLIIRVGRDLPCRISHHFMCTLPFCHAAPGMIHGSSCLSNVDPPPRNLMPLLSAWITSHPSGPGFGQGNLDRNGSVPATRPDRMGSHVFPLALLATSNSCLGRTYSATHSVWPESAIHQGSCLP